MKKIISVLAVSVLAVVFFKTAFAVNLPPTLTSLQADTIITQTLQDQLGGIYQSDDFAKRIRETVKDYIANNIPQNQWQDAFDSIKLEFGIYPVVTPLQTLEVIENSPLLGKTIKYKSITTADTESRAYAGIITTIYENHIADIAVFGGANISYKYKVSAGYGEGQWSPL